MSKSILLAICDPVMRSILEKRLDREGFGVIAVESVEAMDRKALAMKPSAVVFDLSCELSVKGAIDFVKSHAVLHSAQFYLYGQQLNRDEVDAIAHKQVDGVFVGTLMRPKEIVDFIIQDLK